MCDIMERLMRENNAQSYEKGVEQANIKTIKNAVNKGLPYDMIAEIVSLPVEEVKKLAVVNV